MTTIYFSSKWRPEEIVTRHQRLHLGTRDALIRSSWLCVLKVPGFDKPNSDGLQLT